MGVKMGQIVSDAVEKEMKKALKEAEKQSTKSQKQSCAGSAQVHDQHTRTTHLDIRVPDKRLGDEGASALIVGLESALKNGTESVHLALKDLNLAKNGMTTTSLRLLAPVIDMARHTLKSLNLSYNKIEVETEQQMLDWQCFLTAFENCTAFLWLDLTGNTKLGAKALEILAKLHVRTDDLQPIKMPDRERRGSHDSGTALTPLSTTDSESSGPRSGLRSIPYITLNDTGLDDSGALWLSYIIEDHFYPNQLTKDGGVETRHYAVSCDGVEWRSKNDTLSKDGQGLLDRVESVRQGLFGDDDRSNPPSPGKDERDIELLIRSRRKLQRCVIAQDGQASSVDLWRAAIKVVCMSRTFTFAANNVPSEQDEVDCGSGSISGRSPADQRAHARPPSNSEHLPLKKGRSLKLDGHYPIRVLTPEVSMSKGSQKFATNLSQMQRPGHITVSTDNRNGGHCGGVSRSGVLQSGDSHGFIKQQDKNARHTLCREVGETHHLDRPTRRLPLAVIQRIIWYTLSPRERDSLTTKQFGRAFRWAQDRTTLRTEMEWLRDSESIQIMRLLESIGCIEYCRE